MKIQMLITTYNRPDQLNTLLSQLNESADHLAANQADMPRIAVDLWNDGGQDIDIVDFSSLELEYHKEEENHGKKCYWKLIGKAYKNLLEKRFNFFIQLPDDVEVERNFFLDAVNQWLAITDPGKISLNLLIDRSRIGRTNWTNFIPKIKAFGKERYFLTGWNDLCFISSEKMLEGLNYTIKPVPADRWKKNPNLSSGVGFQISRRLYAKKKNMYQVRESLVFHGNHASWMNPEERFKNPLISHALDPIHCGVASYPSRIDSLAKSVRSIIDQVDFLHVYLNDYEFVPDFLKREKIQVYLSGDHDGNLGDAGKFFKVDKVNGYYFSIDDDLIYPENYIWHIIDNIERYKRQAVVGLHGRILKPVIKSYYRDKTKVYHFFHELKKDRTVHVLGTGTTGFHTDTIQVERGDFLLPNMSDIWLALLGQKQRIPFISIARNKGWLKHAPLKNPRDTIYEKCRKSDKKQTQVINSIHCWKLHSPHFRYTDQQAVWKKTHHLIPWIKHYQKYGPIDGRSPVIAYLSTRSGCEKKLKRTIASLLPQVDGLNVFLNRTTALPDCLKDPCVHVMQDAELCCCGDLRKAWSFTDSYILTCNDEIIYPPDYVTRIVFAVEHYQRSAVVGCHGVILHSAVSSATCGRKIWNPSMALQQDQSVHITGAHCSGWHSSTFRTIPVCNGVCEDTDLWLSIACQREKIPIICISRPSGWLKMQHDPEIGVGCSSDSVKKQTKVKVSQESWKLFPPPAGFSTWPMWLNNVKFDDFPIHVSIIVPVAENRGFLGEALRSANEQNFPANRFEVIVVNDGCRQITERTVRALWDSQIHLEYIEIENSGQSRAINHALESARGEFITILHDDDLIYPNKLKTLCDELEKNPEIDVAYSLPQYINEYGANITTPKTVRQYLETNKVVTWRNVLDAGGLLIHGTSTIYRTKAVLLAGGWDESLKTAEEWEFHLRLLKFGSVFHGVHEITTAYRIYSGNKSKKYRRKRKNEMAYIRAKLGFQQPGN